MKIFFTTIFILTFFNCFADHWTPKANYPAISKSRPFTFSIGNKGYVGGGEDSLYLLHNDFWEYDQATDNWTQKSDFAGGPITAATAFSINGKGYVLTGYDTVTTYQKVWEYDPVADTWTQKNNFPGQRRGFAVSFAISGKGYIGTGLFGGATALNDWWEYDPIADSWTAKANYVGVGGTENSVGFAVNGKGYITLGANGSIFTTDLWQYDPILDSWAMKAAFPGGTRVDAAAFTIGNKSYVGAGDIGTFYNDFWEYNPVTDVWTQKANLPFAKDETAFFSIGNKGYIGMGDQNGSPWFNDLQEYTADNISGVSETNQLNIFVETNPNPFDNILTFTTNENGQSVITLYDLSSRKLLQQTFTNSTTINTEQLAKGMYLYTLRNKNGIIKNGKVIKE